ncbi:hypothetical protein SAMN04488503_2507 [Humidesulfovibrio mexicanus]|uniref:Uncharacterized protein n=1 Tax=Humidesulfovibrio mexicanus TaxID=147047 RepID=A0A239BGB2_9BACT|nr:hypothetical protein [Humidesulfovibrio mexicanus]SNS06114.1 hypothetical protein SAMN04488503_2507 [Humidesulfovibrio mexicanus]
MLAEKIRNARKALSALGGQVSEDAWAAIKCIQHELDDAGDQAEEIERNWPTPRDGTIVYNPITTSAEA